QTLVIASSYSGNTEETLNAFEDAQRKECSIICMTSGGRLAEITKQNKFPLLLLPQGYPPRAALGYGLGILFSVFKKLGISQIVNRELVDAVSFLERIGNEWKETANSNNLPYILAREIQGSIPLIYSSVGLEAVALRWKMQFNENSKTHAFYFPIPEMNHNEITAWESLPGTERFFSFLTAVLLHISGDHPRINLRMDITKELVTQKGGKVLEVKAKGTTFLSQLLYLIYFGDWVSFYLAMLYHVDPTVIQNINYLKEWLSKNS
ncbi:bifunctional phosphoglucose/phosphomannose isomerase, partial [bacterium]|nr:bifunctional phosphoglucose/phosphomannose isomerase [bacterium]